MLRRTVVLLALVGLAACELPTEAPKWEQTWVVPTGEAIRVSVAELLPTDVFLNGDGTRFVTEAPGVSVQFTLGEMCPTDCTPLDGLVAPKPEFGDTIDTNTALPADLVSALLAGGAFDAVMEHNFNFDPLRPSSDTANPRGYLVIRISSSGNVIAEDSIHGDDQAFPAGTTLVPSLDIQPVAVTDTFDIRIVIYSPDGDPAEIDTSDTLGVALAPSTIEISEATVNAGSLPVTGDSASMDFSGVDETMVERIQSGALVFDVTNPFTVTGTLDVSFTTQPGMAPIQRSLTLEEGSYEQTMEFSGTELQDLLGAETVDVVTSGTVAASGAGGTITVTPTQVLALESEFELVVLVGPTEEL